MFLKPSQKSVLRQVFQNKAQLKIFSDRARDLAIQVKHHRLADPLGRSRPPDLDSYFLVKADVGIDSSNELGILVRNEVPEVVRKRSAREDWFFAAGEAELILEKPVPFHPGLSIVDILGDRPLIIGLDVLFGLQNHVQEVFYYPLHLFDDDAAVSTGRHEIERWKENLRGSARSGVHEDFSTSLREVEWNRTESHYVAPRDEWPLIAAARELGLTFLAGRVKDGSWKPGLPPEIDL